MLRLLVFASAVTAVALLFWTLVASRDASLADIGSNRTPSEITSSGIAHQQPALTPVFGVLSEGPQQAAPPDADTSVNLATTLAPESMSEAEFVAGPHSGGLRLEILGLPQAFEKEGRVEVLAVGVGWFAEYRLPGFEMRKPSMPPIHTITAIGNTSTVFIPWIRSTKICCVVRYAGRTEMFEDLDSADPPRPPCDASVTWSGNAPLSGVVTGLAHFSDGRAAAGFTVRVNPAGSNHGAAPIQIASPADITACRGREATTDAQGRFSVCDLPVGNGAWLALSRHGQLLVRIDNVAIAAVGDSHQSVEVIVPLCTPRTIELRYRHHPLPGIVMAVQGSRMRSASVHCDARGQIDVLVPHGASSCLAFLAYPLLRNSPHVRQSLVEAGLGAKTHWLLAAFLGDALRTIRFRLDLELPAEQIQVFDLATEQNRLYPDTSDAEQLRIALRQLAESAAPANEQLRAFMDGGPVEPLVMHFLQTLGRAQLTQPLRR